MKVKIKSLAAESRIIRQEERRAIGRFVMVLDQPGGLRYEEHPAREELHLHRVGTVRHEARATLIAYGYLRGLRLRQMEATDSYQDWSRVKAMVVKYGLPGAADGLDAWRKGEVPVKAAA
jgi:hypothetical protein